ncbi:MAG TPA: low affinity iron permease family protein [Allosphingosinicella sp.]
MDRIFTIVAGRIARAAGQPFAFIGSLFIILLWIVSGPIFHYSDTWQLIINTATTIVTFLMVFLIQNSQNRDAAAMQAKLDELIRAVQDARGQFIGIEHLPDAEICRIRDELETEFGEAVESLKPPPGRSVARLINRY